MIIDASPRIRVLLYGGIGNQLFQYAYGVKVSEGKPERVMVDMRGLPSRGQQKSATIEDLRIPIQTVFRGSPLGNYFWKLFLRKSFSLNKSPLSDRFLGISRGLQGETVQPKSIVIANYFIQTEAVRYIKDYSPLSLDTEPRAEVLEEYVRCASDQAIVIHHRLGDSLKIKNSRGQLGPDYFRAAVKNIRAYAPSAQHIRVHSDDPSLSRKILGSWLEEDSMSWASPDLSAAESLTSLARAKHLILSNSTMSWWAAAAGNHESVVTPSRWSILEDKPLNMPGWTEIEPNWI